MSRVRSLSAPARRSPLFVLFTSFAALAAGCSNPASNPVSPDPRSAPVVQLGLTVAIDAAGSAIALPGVNDVRATMTAPPIAAITSYSVNYGDGSTSSEASSSHVYQTAGTYTIDASAVLRSGQVLHTSASVQVKPFTGAFYVGDFNPRTGRFEVRKVSIDAQDGRTLQVRWVPAGQTAYQAASGEIQNERQVSIVAENGALRLQGAVPSRVTVGETETFDLQVAQSADTSLAGRTLRFRGAIEPTGAPPTAQLAVRVGSTNSTNGIAGFNPMTFSANGTIDSSSTYAMEFGDGGFALGTPVSRPCGPQGWYTARLSVLDRAGRVVSTTASYNCTSLFYGVGWVSVRQNPPGGAATTWWLVFTVQNGATAEGTYYHLGQNSSHFQANLTGDQSIRITLDDGTIDFSGTADGTRMHLTLRGGPDDGRTMDFVPYDPY